MDGVSGSGVDGVVGFMGGVDGGVVSIGVDGCIAIDCIGCIACVTVDCVVGVVVGCIGVDVAGCIGVGVGVAGCIGVDVGGVGVGGVGCTSSDTGDADSEPDTKPDTGVTPSSILPHACSGSSASVIVAGPRISGPSESLLPGSIPASPYRDSSRGSVRGTLVGVLPAARTPPSARWSSSDSVTSPRYAS